MSLRIANRIRAILRYLWPRCGFERKDHRCTRGMWHSGRHRYPRRIEKLLIASIEQARKRG